MKKSYSIGRDEFCDIVIYDLTNVVSRNHATLRVDGKRYFLTDHSTNGTFRNGIRLTPHVEYPVSPEDDISLGNAVPFDWRAIPASQKKGAPVWLYIFLPIALLLIAGGIYYLLPRSPKAGQAESAPILADSLRTAPSADTLKRDSLVVLPDVLTPKKTPKKAATKTKAAKKAEPKKKAFDNYKDSDDETPQDAL